MSVAVSVIEFAAGLLITGVTLVDVFSSILVPGPAKTALHVVGRMRQLSLPLWRWMSGGGRRKRLSNSFAPLLFSLAFLSWLVLLCAGFGLMLHACASSFRPPLRSVGDAFYVAGSNLLTVGTAAFEPQGFARFLLLIAALSGFGVITATITFILEIQTNLHERESGVLKLGGISGSPPSGLGLLENFAALGLKQELPAFFREWADWSASVMNSHVSFPVLVYFHSVGAECDWVVALQIVLDAATLLMALTDERCAGSAVYLHRTGSRTAAHIAGIFRLDEKVRQHVDLPALQEVVGRLRAAGYSVRDPDDEALAKLRDLRSDYLGRVRALGEHLGSEHRAIVPQVEQRT